MISFLIQKSENDPPQVVLGRFRKFVELDQSKGIGGLARPRRSRFGCWFGRLRRRGGEID